MIRSFCQKKKMLYRIKKRTVAYSRLVFFVILRVGQVPFSQNFSFYFFPFVLDGQGEFKDQYGLMHHTKKTGSVAFAGRLVFLLINLTLQPSFTLINYSFKQRNIFKFSLGPDPPQALVRLLLILHVVCPQQLPRMRIKS